MKNIDPAIITAFEAEQVIPALLVDILVGGDSFYFSNRENNIVYNGNHYVPRGFVIDGISYSSSNIVNNVTINLDDVNRALLGAFGGVSAEKYPVKVMTAVLDSFYKIIGAVVVFSGYANQWNYTPGKFKLIASSIFEQWGRITTDRFSSSCRWEKFKGEWCKYSGQSDECDRTYSQCEAYGNTVNYGGFRWLPSLINKTIKA